DTDHITILHHPAGPAFTARTQRMAQHPASDLAVSLISFHEQVLGANAAINRARTDVELLRGYSLLEVVQQIYAKAQVVPFDQPALAIFRQLETQRIRIGTMDLRIAAIALSRGLIVLIRNSRDFSRVPGLQIQDWTV